MIPASDIERLREELVEYPDAIAALDVIADCEGDLNDAAISLALRVGQEPNTSEDWLASYAKRFRHVLCRAELRTDFNHGRLQPILTTLQVDTTCPTLLALPVALHALEAGIDEFCYSFDHSRITGTET